MWPAWITIARRASIVPATARTFPAMRVAALYDIHGNLPALEAVLLDVRSQAADLVVVGGDVMPGPMRTETLDCLTGLDIPVRFIRGNGDRVVAAQHRGAEPVEVPA